MDGNTIHRRPLPVTSPDPSADCSSIPPSPAWAAVASCLALHRCRYALASTGIDTAPESTRERRRWARRHRAASSASSEDRRQCVRRAWATSAAMGRRDAMSGVGSRWGATWQLSVGTSFHHSANGVESRCKSHVRQQLSEGIVRCASPAPSPTASPLAHICHPLRTSTVARAPSHISSYAMRAAFSSPPSSKSTASWKRLRGGRGIGDKCCCACGR